MKLAFPLLFLICNICCLAQETDSTFYSTGELFSYRMGYYDDLVHLQFKLDQSGDTISLDEHDFSGNIKDFTYRSYCKNEKGEYTLLDGQGFFNYYLLHRDSLYIKSRKERHPLSIFFELKRYSDLESHHFLNLDTVFLEAFYTRKEFTKEKFKDRLYKKVDDLQIGDSINLQPFIHIAAEMLYTPWEEKQRVKDIEAPKDRLPIYFKMFNKEVRNTNEFAYVYEYLRYQAELPKGEWLYYSGLTRFLGPQVSEQCLYNSYVYSLRSIVNVSEINLKTNTMFEPFLHKLSVVVDTLGDSFQQKKKTMVANFFNSLTDMEKESLKIVASKYDKVLSNYYVRFVEDNKNRTGGLDINRLKYYELITKWQLKFPNYRLFKQNNKKKIAKDRWKSDKLPENFETILEKFDEYMGEEIYSELVESEESMFNSMEGFNSYTLTPFNPYMMEREPNKRKFRRFNWLVK